ncbi:DoxX family protein [Dermatophilus congolensis]|uniref:Inner membrane protein yphA n=1 Tax=Dermatophilus congolensis TaxID=1863 RepID=A0A239V5Z0_9MICO|nr:DoxX family protein [Dermatophilus congolensis]SNV17625.1 Inner membrane protein yphA [Dermatophilus congolensis]
MSLPDSLRATALLLARLLLGVVLIAHGWQKFFLDGISATAAAFTRMGAPMPYLSATAAATIELIGGVLIVLGAATVLTALVVAANMFGAFVIAHMGHGIFIKNGGWELVGMIGAVAITLAVTGAGRFSADELLHNIRRHRDSEQPSHR